METEAPQFVDTTSMSVRMWEEVKTALEKQGYAHFPDLMVFRRLAPIVPTSGPDVPDEPPSNVIPLHHA